MSNDKLSPFEVAGNINEKKEYLDPDTLQASYSPWMINKVMSNTRDTVLLANEMNRFHGLAKDMQYSFYYHGISRKKRFGKWNKNQDDSKAIALVMERYPQLSYKRAREVLPILVDHLGSIEHSL